jgi:O-antigen/teichoic acid export membrane protein
MSTAARRWFARLEQRFRMLTFLHTMVPTVAALGVQLLAFAATARGLGVEQFGRYTGVLAVAAVGVELAGLGTMDILVRAVARDKSRFSRYFGHMIIMLLASWPVIVLAGALVALWLMGLALPWPWLLAALAAEVLLGRVPANLEMMMVAHSDTVKAGWVRFVGAAARLAAAAIYFLLLDLHTLTGWITTLCITAAVVTTASFLWARLSYGPATRWFAKDEVGAGIVFCLTHVSSSVQNNLDRMLLTRFASSSDVGAYGAATRVLQLGTFPLQVATRITYPRFFAPENEGLARGRALARRLVAPMLGLGVVSALGVMAAALAIPHILGRDFDGSVQATMILAWALPFIALQTPPADALVAAGLHSVRAVIQWIASLSFGLALLIGVHLAGTTGLVLAYVFAQALLALVLWLAAHLWTDPATQTGAQASSIATAESSAETRP